MIVREWVKVVIIGELDRLTVVSVNVMGACLIELNWKLQILSFLTKLQKKKKVEMP
jgi:hypothetical protein